MQADDSGPFGHYAPEAQTTTGAGPTKAEPTDIETALQVDERKYGSGKPYRIITRAIVAANRDDVPTTR